MLDAMERRTSDPAVARRPLPPRPPHHPHAQARGGPDHLVRGHARPRLARSGARRRRAARRGRRGRGLRPGRRGQRVARPGGGDRRQRRHPPGRRAGRERHGLLPAQHQDRGQGGPGGHRPGRGGRGPRARAVGWTRLADINRRLANPPEFDLANSEQLGLFVVSWLAARHEIKVSLRRSAYGGTTAIVLLPFGVIVRGGRGRLARHRPVRRLARRRPGDPAWAGHPARADTTCRLGGRRLVAVRRDRPAPAARGRDRAAGRTPARASASRDQEWPPPAPRTCTAAALGVPRRSRSRSDRPAAAPPARAELGRHGTPSADHARGLQPAQQDVTAPAGCSRWIRLARTPRRPCRPRSPRLPRPPAGTHLGMPIRVPQASLAPQLRPDQATRARRRRASEAPDVDAAGAGGDARHADDDAARLAARARR